MTLIDRALEQIKQDVDNQDFTAIAELLLFVPENILKGFISEVANKAISKDTDNSLNKA
jgi:hypothetical protein